MRVQRAVLRLRCGCGREWFRHGVRGVKQKRGSAMLPCPLRVVLVERNVARGTVRVTFEMPLRQEAE